MEREHTSEKKCSNRTVTCDRLGRQDKSADGCRAHVVGWTAILADMRGQRAGASATIINDFNHRSAIAGADLGAGRY